MYMYLIYAGGERITYIRYYYKGLYTRALSFREISYTGAMLVYIISVLQGSTEARFTLFNIIHVYVYNVSKYKSELLGAECSG